MAELGIRRWPAWLQKGEERGEKRRCWSGKVGLAEVVCQNRAQQGWGKRSRPKHTAQQSEEKECGAVAGQMREK